MAQISYCFLKVSLPYMYLGFMHSRALDLSVHHRENQQTLRFSCFCSCAAQQNIHVQHVHCMNDCDCGHACRDTRAGNFVSRILFVILVAAVCFPLKRVVSCLHRSVWQLCETDVSNLILQHSNWHVCIPHFSKKIQVKPSKL